MTDLADFLRARLTEDAEAAASACQAGVAEHWQWVTDRDATLDGGLPADTPIAPEELEATLWEVSQSVSLRSVEEHEASSMPGTMLPTFVGPVIEEYGPGVQHIVRWDPARVLREVQAKRQVLSQYEAAKVRELAEFADEETDGSGAHVAVRVTGVLRDAVVALTLPYADHADYDEAWKP